MNRLVVVPALALLLLAPTGCDFYFSGGDDEPPPCPGGAIEPDGSGAPLGIRNPSTGQCEYWGGGGGWCDETCGPCPQADEPALQPAPSWGFCESLCTGLDEDTCRDTEGCRGAYIDTCPADADCSLGASDVFYECWAVDMTGPIQGGDCYGLDAWECSRHDDCRAIHRNSCRLDDTRDRRDPACLGEFAMCAQEQRALPDPGQCYGEVYCDALPPACSDPDAIPGRKDGCWTGLCIPTSECEQPPDGPCSLQGENVCIARADCDPIYEGVDCTCDASGCTCSDWVFNRCEEVPNSGTP